MNSLCSTLMYGSKLLLRSSLVTAVSHRSPLIAAMLFRAKQLAGDVLEQRSCWLRVRSGPAEGAWMHLHLPIEAGYWTAAHEPDLQECIAAHLRAGHVAYDIGAHIGFTTAAMAQRVGAAGRVIAFEADCQNVMRLREHLERNRWTDRVEIVHRAVWEESLSSIAFRRGGTLGSRGGIEHGGVWPVLGSGDVVQLASIRIDDFVRTRGPKPDFIKIDVEGAEAEVLHGATGTVRRYAPILAVEVHHAEALAKIERWIRGFSYTCDWRVPSEGFPRRLVALPRASVAAKAFQ